MFKALAHGAAGAESKNLRDLFDEDLVKEIDYESDTEFVGPNGSPLAIITGEEDNSRIPSPFTERGMWTRIQRYVLTFSNVTSEVNTNPLIEQ